MEQNKKMENGKMKYMEKKWSVWFRTLDHNKDDKISTDDLDKSANKFEEIKKELKSGESQDNLGDEGSDNEQFNIKKWWNHIFPKSTAQSMTKDEFVKSLAEAYQEDNATFRKKMKQCFGYIANFVTTDMKRIITKKEFADGFMAFNFGQVDEGKIKEAYELFAARGEVTVQLLVDAWVQFATDDDQSKQDVIMKIYEK